MISQLVISFTCIWVVSAQISQNCTFEWREHARCMKNKQSEYRKTTDMSSQDQAELKNKMRQCYKNENCRNPFLSEQEIQIRQKCYLRFRDRLRSDFLGCVQKKYADFQMPPEDDSAVARGQDMLSVRRQSCKPQDEKRFKQCLFTARGRKGFNQQSKRRDYCEVRAQCYETARLKQGCYNRSSAVREALCNCSKILPASTYKDIYQQCLRENNVASTNETRDYNLLVLKNLNAGEKYCSNFSDPCGGFKGRQSVGRQRQGGRGDRGGRGRGSDRQSGSKGGSVPQGSSSTTINTEETGDLGTSASSGIDSGSIMSGSNIVPDANSLIGSLGTQDLGATSLISSQAGSLNPASLMGGGFDIQQILGGAGGAGGLGAPLDLGSLFSGFGGGGEGAAPFDLSSIMSGFGGKKKK